MGNSECLLITQSVRQGIDVYSNVYVGISCPYYNIKVEQSKILNRNKCKKFVDFDKRWYYIYEHGRYINRGIHIPIHIIHTHGR